MTKVRFRSNYCADINNRIAYELAHKDYVLHFDAIENKMSNHYNLKLLGLVPARKLEPADGSEVDAIDVFIKLTNTQIQ